MSLDGSVCFFVLYHYKTNSILATPITNLDDKSIFTAYKANFEMLEAKGYKPKVNVMDNQATEYIKKFLTKKGCQLQLVEPHNHRVNGAERAIQTFKDAFIAALATTNKDFPLQLWDKLAPQVQNTLNLLRTLRKKPEILAYEALYGPYDWNWYPLAPPGCKAIIYEAPAVRGSWASRGTNAWYLGPSKDHNRCNLFYVPKTRAYHISGSAEIFPQHCQVPNLSRDEHLKALTEELHTNTTVAARTTKGKPFSNYSACMHLDELISPPPTRADKRVTNIQLPSPNPELRELQRVTNSLAIMHAWDPTAKRNLINTTHTHWRNTQRNTPGDVPAIQRSPNHIPANTVLPTQPQRLPRITQEDQTMP